MGVMVARSNANGGGHGQGGDSRDQDSVWESQCPLYPLVRAQCMAKSGPQLCPKGVLASGGNTGLQGRQDGEVTGH